MRVIVNLWISMVTLFPGPAFASSGWDDHATHMLYFQLLNVTILFGALIYFLKDSAIEHFKKRAQDYHAEALRAQQLLKEAQWKLADLQSSLTKVETTWAESLSRAQAEAADLRNRLNQQSDQSTQRMIEDARRAIQVEQNNQYQKFISDLIKTATIQVEQKLKTQLSDEDHKRLQKSFNKSVEGANL
jgi:F0F1-type ATP synthase membrane subunit b/b'